MYHTTLQAMSVELVSVRDMILNTPVIDYGEFIMRRKQLQIDKN